MVKTQRTKQISLRVPDGWESVVNESETVCDRCGARLWVAPDGQIYCDRVHDPSSDTLLGD